MSRSINQALRGTAAAIALAGLAACAYPPPPPATVAALDVPRYSGTWHEVARFPNDFQDGFGQRCEQVTATYTPRPDGQISVHNACIDAKAGGKYEDIQGHAYVTEPGGGKLRVTFFWPFYADYWVLGLDPEYRWAVVGSPSRNYLWILSRTPVLDAASYEKATAIAAAQKYDLKKLVKTPPQS